MATFDVTMNHNSDGLLDIIVNNPELKRKYLEKYGDSLVDLISDSSVELPDRRSEVRVRSPVLDDRQLPSHADLKIDTQVSKYKTVFGAATHPKLSQQGMVALNSGAVDIHSRILVPNIEEPDEITDLEVASLLVGIGQVGKRAERSQEVTREYRGLPRSWDGTYLQAPTQRRGLPDDLRDQRVTIGTRHATVGTRNATMYNIQLHDHFKNHLKSYA